MQAVLTDPPAARNARLCLVVPVQHACPDIDESEVDRERGGECWVYLSEAVEAIEWRESEDAE